MDSIGQINSGVQSITVGGQPVSTGATSTSTGDAPATSTAAGPLQKWLPWLALGSFVLAVIMILRKGGD